MVDAAVAVDTVAAGAALGVDDAAVAASVVDAAVVENAAVAVAELASQQGQEQGRGQGRERLLGGPIETLLSPVKVEVERG